MPNAIAGSEHLDWDPNTKRSDFAVNTSRALASFVTCATDTQFRSDHLKLCVLWYDETLIETLGDFDQYQFLQSLVGEQDKPRKTIKDLSDLIVPLSSKISSDVIRDVRESGPIGYPRGGEKHENYTYPEPESAEEYAHNRLLERIASEHGVERFDDGYDIEQAEGRARVAVDAVRLWDCINRELPCMLQASPDEKLAMTAAQQFAANADQPPTPFGLFGMTIPSLSVVPWHQIVRLRRDGALASLRSKIAEAMDRAGPSLVAAKKVLDDVEKSAMDNIVDLARPKPTKVAIEAVVANVPGLPVNPASLYFGIRDSASASKRSKEFGWLYLLRDIRAAAETT